MNGNFLKNMVLVLGVTTAVSLQERLSLKFWLWGKEYQEEVKLI